MAESPFGSLSRPFLLISTNEHFLVEKGNEKIT